MATHETPGNDQDEPTVKRARAVMQAVEERVEEADGAVESSELEYSNDSNTENEIRAPVEVLSDTENQDPENNENNYNGNGNLRVTREEFPQGRRQVIGEYTGGADENSRSFIYDDNFNNLYPNVFKVIEKIRQAKLDRGREWHQNERIPPDTEHLYETSLKYLLQQPEPVGPFDTEEKKAHLSAYLTLRKDLLLTIAQDYHQGDASRPGSEHEFGYLFPVKTSYNMVEYFRVAFVKLGHPLPFQTAIDDVEFPELDEYNPRALQLIKRCISNHKTPEMRKKIFRLVSQKTHLSPNNKKTLDSLIDEMNMMFKRNFEYTVIEAADNHFKEEQQKMNRAENILKKPAKSSKKSREQARELQVHANMEIMMQTNRDQAYKKPTDKMQATVMETNSNQADMNEANTEQWNSFNEYTYLNQNTQYRSDDQEPSTSSSSPSYTSL